MPNDQSSGCFLIEYQSGPLDGEVVTLEASEAIIGQGGEGITIALPHDKLASPRHARLSVKDGRIVVEDLQSTAGTLVNNERIEAERELESSDVVRVGHTEFTCRLPTLQRASVDEAAAARDRAP